MIVKCNNCEKLFEKSNSEIKRSKTGRHYCSKSCSAQSNNRGVTRNKPTSLECKACGASYVRQGKHRSRSFCKGCFPKWGKKSEWYKILTVQEYYDKDSVKNKHPSWKSAHVRSFCRSWNKDLADHPCQNCGYSLHVEFCHIKPISSHPPDTLLGEINSSDNVLILCRNCHWEFDHNHLQIDDVPPR